MYLYCLLAGSYHVQINIGLNMPWSDRYRRREDDDDELSSEARHAAPTLCGCAPPIDLTDPPPYTHIDHHIMYAIRLCFRRFIPRSDQHAVVRRVPSLGTLCGGVVPLGCLGDYFIPMYNIIYCVPYTFVLLFSQVHTTFRSTSV